MDKFVKMGVLVAILGLVLMTVAFKLVMYLIMIKFAIRLLAATGLIVCGLHLITTDTKFYKMSKWFWVCIGVCGTLMII